MAATLDVQGLVNALIQAQERSTNSNDPESARRVYAQAVAEAIHAFVLSGTVTTIGSATTQTGKLE